MKYNELGTSGLRVPNLCIGCWAFGGGEYWGGQSQKDVDAVVAAAIDRGFNFFDTAEVYNNGESENSLGKALAGRRGKAVIASKISPAGAGSVREHLEGSLSRLKTDYLDIYMLHWPINELSIAHYAPGQKEAPPTSEEFFAALSAVQKEGLVRTIGISNFGVKQMREALATGAAITVNELTYNIVSRAIETDIAGFCEKNSISIIGSMALQQGLLTGKYAAPEEVPPPQAHSRHFHHTRGGEQSRHGEEGAEEEIFQVVALLKQLSAETGRTPGSIAIAWVLSKKFIASALVGCRSLGQLEANIAASAIELPHDIIQRIDEVSLPALNKLGSSPDYYENRKKSRSF